MIEVQAQTLNIGGGTTIKGPLVGIESIGDLINKLLFWLVPFAFLILLGVIIWGGADLMMSQGSPDKVKTARAKITSGVIGIILIVFAYFITSLIGYIFGFGKGVFY